MECFGPIYLTKDLKMSAKTSRKLKTVGTETYINISTGEVHEMNVVEIEDKDANFLKLWVSSILAAVDELSNQRLKVVFWLVEKAGKNRNIITKTTRELSDEIGVSKTTIVETLKILERHDILRRKTGVIFMSPDVVYKGSRNGRLEVLTRYRQLPKVTDLSESSSEKKAAKLLQQMDILMKQLHKIENELRDLQLDSAAE